MPVPTTPFTAQLAYLLGLGTRHLEIGRAELTSDGQASGNTRYPLVLVEADVQGSETNAGLDTLTFAIQVLDMPERIDPRTGPDLLGTTKTWADELTQQLRDEQPGALAGVNYLALPGQAGSDLATGWRMELQLKVPKQIDRNANAAKFAPLA